MKQTELMDILEEDYKQNKNFVQLLLQKDKQSKQKKDKK